VYFLLRDVKTVINNAGGEDYRKGFCVCDVGRPPLSEKGHGRRKKKSKGRKRQGIHVDALWIRKSLKQIKGSAPGGGGGKKDRNFMGARSLERTGNRNEGKEGKKQ